MLTSATVAGADFGYADALVALLTVETLAFAALAVAVSFSIPTNRIPNLKVSLPTFGKMAATFVTVVAFGGCVAWMGIFHKHWPHGFYNAVISGVLAISIVVQPAFAWVVALALKPKE
jgi:hypothetical protein